MHSSIGACHNIGSCGRLISAGTVQTSHSLLLPIAATIGQAPHRLPSVRGRRIKPGLTAYATELSLIDAKTTSRQYSGLGPCSHSPSLRALGAPDAAMVRYRAALDLGHASDGVNSTIYYAEVSGWLVGAGEPPLSVAITADGVRLLAECGLI